ncbi:hypothetical protein DXG03_000030 [Asterophora parasitica]|uniref:DUF952 domain-containing protein n=1 Tax=Asterophora parasitica TaxID=117018 RepID=A0A9P7GDS5_9AGAR|nr:hypothetical protein DXG03_000030 [Asterophora parasitica]
MSVPQYIYKLVPSELIVSPLPERLPLSPLDTNDGFIHLSTAAQLPQTLGRYFAKENKLYILRLEYTRIEKVIRWEDPGGQTPGEIGAEGVFPHLYNDGQLGMGEVESVFEVEKDGNNWDLNKIKALEWLLY